jgi:hypothetical protein
LRTNLTDRRLASSNRILRFENGRLAADQAALAPAPP